MNIDSKWYREGILARELGHEKNSCPYKNGSYGYYSWHNGYNTIDDFVTN
jgi:hypothetical protein